MYEYTNESTGSSPVAQSVKNLPEMRETGVQSLRQEDPLEKEMATQSSIFVWKIPWIEKSARPQSMGSQELNMTLQLNHHHESTEYNEVKK